MGSSIAPDFDELARQSTGKDSGIVPGCVLAAIDSKGELFYHKAFGDGGVAKDAKPIDINGTFWIASCTKLLTSICALRFVEQGKVDLDEDITRLLPELKDLPIITADESAEDGYTLKPRTKTITLRAMLTHTSGIGYQFMSPLLNKWRQKNGPPLEQLKGKVQAVYTTPLLFEPGESWMYGGGLDWAGIMVERLSGKKLGDYMAEAILDPLGMTSTTFHIDQHPDLLARLVPCATRLPDGTLAPAADNGFALTMDEHSGGGGLWSSATDYIKLLGDLISPSPKVLSAKTIETMLAAPQLEAGSPALEQLTSGRMSAISANAAALNGTPPINHGLGGMFLTKDTPLLPGGSLSWGGLPNLKWFFNRKEGVAAFYATQILPSGDTRSNELSSKFFTEVVRLHRERAGAAK